jgi:hypothetical protein
MALQANLDTATLCTQSSFTIYKALQRAGWPHVRPLLEFSGRWPEQETEPVHFLENLLPTST